MRIVALDLGKRKISYCEVKEGHVHRRLTVSCIETLESELGVDQAAASVAIEACREAWRVHDLLTSWGNKVVVVDTTRVRRLGVGPHGRKTDRVDAEVLALALERGGIPMAHVLSPARRELRRCLGVRTNSVRLGRFRLAVIQAWSHTLRRRSQRARMTRKRMLAFRWLPPNRVQHPWPSERFDARIRGKSPVR
jgi:hypothetical protein